MITWLSHIIFIIATLILFVIAKLKFKVQFDYKKVFKLSIVVALCSYVFFTLINIWIPVIIALDNVHVDIYFYIVGELVGFIIGSVILAEIFYAIGKAVYKKL